MAKLLSPVCKLCRREGEKLFLKGERCFTPKCSFDKRSFAPGQHGRTAGRGGGKGMGTGAPYIMIQRALATGPGIIDELLAEAKSHPLPGEVKTTTSGVIDYSVIWKEQSTQDFDPANPQNLGAILYEKRNFMYQMWMNGLIEEGIRHKLVLFWSNHFTSALNAHTWTFQYYYLLHKNALGNCITIGSI